MDTPTVTDAAHQAKQALTQNLRRMIDETDQFLKSAAAKGDEKFDAVRDQMVQQVRRMRAQLDELEECALHQAKHAARSADRTVQAHPYGAMGLAAAAGLLIGFLAARR